MPNTVQRFDSATLALVSTELLHEEDSTDQMFETRQVLSYGLACQACICTTHRMTVTQARVPAFYRMQYAEHDYALSEMSLPILSPAKPSLSVRVSPAPEMPALSPPARLSLYGLPHHASSPLPLLPTVPAASSLLSRLPMPTEFILTNDSVAAGPAPPSPSTLASARANYFTLCACPMKRQLSEEFAELIPENITAPA